MSRLNAKHWIAAAAIATGAAGGLAVAQSHSTSPVVARVPGIANPDVTQANIATTICVSGWTATIRPSASYTTALKRQQLAALRYRDQNPSDFEEDHEISLEIGGAPADPQNLWPEPYPRARTVDQIENSLHRQVCAGTITLAEAQRQIVAIKHKDG